MQKRINKRGQMTIWIIIAIAIIFLGIIAFFVYNTYFRITPEQQSQQLNPNTFMGECLSQYLEPLVTTISKQGGYLEEPAIFIPYNGSKVGYLCYTNEAYKVCYNQQPFLDKFIEEELKDELKKENAVKICLANFEAKANSFNYQMLRCKDPDFNVTLTINKILTNFNCNITMTKDDKITRYNKIEAEYNHPLGEFVALTKKIIERETLYGDYDIILNKFYDPYVLVDKIRGGDTKAYVLTKLSTDKSFVFAVKNLVLHAQL